MTKAYVKYLSALLLFGLNGVVASHIPLTSYEIVLSRTLIGSLFLAIVFAGTRMRGRLSPGRKGLGGDGAPAPAKAAGFAHHKKQLAFLAVSGAAMGASWMFLYEAYGQIGVSLATLAYYTGPVILMALAPVVFQEKITAAKIIGFAAVLLGMLFVNGAQLLSGGLSWGLVCGILSAVTYCAMVIFNKKATGLAGIENAMCQLAAAFVVVAAFTLLARSGTVAIPTESIVPILVLGIVNTGTGCYLYFSSIQKLSAQTVSICGYLEPLSALIFSALLLGERLTAIQVAGAVLILSGAAFGELYKRRSARGNLRGFAPRPTKGPKGPLDSL